MFEGDNATQAEETQDLFPVRDIATNRPKMLLISSKLSAEKNSQETIDFYLNSKGFTFFEKREKFYKLIHIWYNKTCFEASYAIYDIKNTWHNKTGGRSEKTKAISKLMMYYLLILAMYVIKSSFWIDRKLIEGSHKILLNSKKNTQMLIGLGIVFSLIVVAYLIGAPSCPEPVTSTDP